MRDPALTHPARPQRLPLGRVKFALALAADGAEDDLELAAGRLRELAAVDSALAADLQQLLALLFGADLTGAFTSDN
jgi:hypothetical protein